MKILIIYSFNNQQLSPFIQEQIESLESQGVEFTHFKVIGKGIKGYLKVYFTLRKFIRKNKSKVNLIHAHYGLSGLLASFQNKLPYIVTYHGSDIHQKKNLKYSKVAMNRAAHNIFVSKRMKEVAGSPVNSSVIPCGVDTDLFKPLDQKVCRRELNLELDKEYILFSSSFDNSVKNASLAIKAVKNMDNTELIELKNYSREQVVYLMNAVDLCLLTSFNEGSPQFIKEAMACNCPIVSTDVGDVSELIMNIKGCYLTEFNTVDVLNQIDKAIAFRTKHKFTEGRRNVFEFELSLNQVASKIIHIYSQQIKKTQ